ncbi:acyltransferase [Actinoplanes sp. LDG1-06]|uniref:Acyltransferase n=1 Tax=Paractinoplanes ovalisporus TaxID=2810368 RepID=A0ABS2AJ20_9ACTN|nr:acyltransferase [Actinoplanes ovalisporus]MBM2619790.1 acyltransferase [Actinoplanes ovalisporus]
MAEPRARDRYFDLLRVVAIIRVSVFHMFPYALLELAFPSMGVMFALAGSLMAGSLARSATPRVLYGRVRRLLPAYWVLAAIVVPVMLLEGWDDRPALWRMLAWIVPFTDPPYNALGEQAGEVLWYLVTYFWLVLLSPLMLWLYRRARPAAILLPLALLVFHHSDLLMYAPCWILGFAHRDGSLRRVPAWLVTLLAVGCVGGGLAYAHVTSTTLPDTFIPYAVYQLGFVLVLLRGRPSVPASRWVSLVNARAVTIYLWNNVAIALCFPVGDVFEAWRLGQAGYALIALALLANAVLLFGWVEDVAARRRPRFLPWPSFQSDRLAHALR